MLGRKIVAGYRKHNLSQIQNWPAKTWFWFMLWKENDWSVFLGYECNCWAPPHNFATIQQKMHGFHTVFQWCRWIIETCILLPLVLVETNVIHLGHDNERRKSHPCLSLCVMVPSELHENTGMLPRIKICWPTDSQWAILQVCLRLGSLHPNPLRKARYFDRGGN